jgi:CBS domain-containing protein
MLRLRQIMTTDVLTVAPETSLREAMELLGRNHVSGAPVVSGSGILLGIVTTTDLMMFVSGLSGVPTEREAHEWRDAEAHSAEGDVAEERASASEFFSELWDDVGADASTRIGSSEGPEWNVLEEHDVSEIMTATPLTTLGPDADAATAADLMSRLGIHRILVTEGDTLVGIVSAMDIARAAASGKLTARTYVFNHDGNRRRFE